MSKTLPARFLKSATLLQEVPKSEFLDAPICEEPLNPKSRLDFFKKLRGKLAPEAKPKINPKQKLTRQFNAAAWLSFKSPPTKPVALLFSYKDCKGEFAVVIDESVPDGQATMMLSGDTSLEFYGELEYLNVIATGLKKEHYFFIEDVHVHRIRPKKANTDKEDYWLVSGE